MTTLCRDKVSADCTGVFEKKKQRGRPPVNCAACIQFKAKLKPAGAQPLDRTCSCGSVFQVKPGRGTKAQKCDDCRTPRPVKRRSDDGLLEAAHADAAERKEQERKAGEQRAMLLKMTMDRLHAIPASSRKVIVH